MFYWHTFSYRIPFDATIYDDGRVWVFAEIAGTCSASVVGLLSIWLAHGTCHWFLRVMPLILLATVLAWIPAHDLGVVAIIQCATVFIPLTIRRRWKKRFHLQELMLLILALCLVLAFAIQVPVEAWRHWRTLLWFGVGFGIVTLIAVGIATSHLSWWKRLILVCLVPYAAIIVAWLMLAVSQRDRNHARLRRVTLASLTLLLVQPLTWMLVILLWRAPIPNDSFAGESGLSELHAAGNSIPTALFAPSMVAYQPSTKTDKQLIPVVTATAEALQRARAAMKRPCWLPVNYELKDPDYNTTVPYRDSLLTLNAAFLAEAELAIRQERLGDASNTYVDILRLAECAGRGGLPRDARLGFEVEKTSLQGIYAVRKQMDAGQLRHWIDLLSARETAFESPEVLMRRRYAWVDRIAPWQDRLVLWYLDKRGGVIPKDMDLYVKFRLVSLRLLSAELGLRLYHLQSGKYPDGLDKLVPNYLSAIPGDPFHSGELVYRRQQNGYLLYSVNLDGKDDGGAKPAGPIVLNRGDLTLDLLF